MVHGGAYEEGNSARYANVEEIGQKFVAKDIIVVAIQYRLGVFGELVDFYLQSFIF
jgi:carboxylesterase type B